MSAVIPRRSLSGFVPRRSLSAIVPVMMALATGCGGAAAIPPPSLPSPLLSQPAPDFRRMAIDGSVVETGAWRGRVALVDFFAEYCAPCARRLPSIEALHRSMPDLVVIGVSEDEETESAARVVQTHGLTFPVVHDDGHALAGRFRVTDLPSAFVVDARGVVRWYGGGDGEDNDVRAAVRSAR